MSEREPKAPIESFAQNHEDLTVWNLVKDREPGHFIDIGAADGKTLSNTLNLYQQGWKGVLVEASPYAVPALVDRYGKDPDMMIVAAAIGERDVPVGKFHLSRDLVSSGNDEHYAVWKDTVPFSLIHVPFVSANSFFAWLLSGPGVGRKYPVLSIDVEGNSVQVFEQAPLDALGVDVVVVEYDHRADHVRSAAAARGFEQVEQTSENLVLRRRP